MRKKLILIQTFTKMPECFTSREFYDELRMNGFEESWFEGDAIPKFLKDKCYHEFRGKSWGKKKKTSIHLITQSQKQNRK